MTEPRRRDGRPIAVGFTSTEAGNDALAVGVRLARATGAPLELICVLPARGVVVPLDVGYESVVRERAQRWLDDALGTVPPEVPASGLLRYADSPAQGLAQASRERDAAGLVVGAADGSVRGRFGLGSATNALVHSARVPLVLAPAGSAATDTPLSRITVGVGTRPGAAPLIAATADLATAAQVPVRLVSLIALDLPRSIDPAHARLAADSHLGEALTGVREQLPAELSVEATTAQGETIGGVVADLDWQPGEMVLVGSSRLARRRHIFLGSTAARMLRALPVPMIVIPREPKGD